MLSGTVRDSRPNAPAISGATVRLDNGQATATGSDGRYNFPNVSGVVTVTASDPHHVAESVTTTMDQGRTVDFALENTGAPPFEGTVFISPNVITSSDSTALASVEYSGRGRREVFDRREDRWVMVNAYLFDLRYARGTGRVRGQPPSSGVEPRRARRSTRTRRPWGGCRRS